MKNTLKLIGLFALTVLMGFAVSGCGNDDDPIPVTGVTLNKNTLSLAVGATEALVATVQPGNATDKSVTWSSSDSAVATVAANGLVTAVANGTATITVRTTEGANEAECVVTVTSGGGVTVNVTGVTLSANTLGFVIGATEQLTADVQPGNAANKSVTWSSNNTAVATVNNNGLVTAVGAGTAAITVTTVDGSHTATCVVTVTAGTVNAAGVTLNKNTLSLAATTSEQLTAEVQPGNATNKSVTWSSSDPAVATVNSSGLVTAVAVGTAAITVTTVDGGFEATCAVTVTPVINATGVTLNTNTLSLAATATGQLTATVQPLDTTNKSVTWSSSDPAAATVNSSGLVTAVAVGTAAITVTTVDGNFTATCVVTVTPAINVTGVTLNKNTLDLLVGGSEQLIATVQPDDATNKNVNWISSNTAAATVAANGIVTAVGNGSTTITVTTVDGGFTASCVVTVTAGAFNVTGVTLNSNTLGLVIGQTGQLLADVQPGNATDRSVTWSSSNPAVAAVNNNGLVTAVGAGTAAITVTTVDGGFTASCNVTVAAHGTGTVYVSFTNWDRQIDLDSSGTVISISNGDSLVVTVIDDFDHYEWSVNLNRRWESVNSITLYANEFNSGRQTLTVICWKYDALLGADVPSSKSLIFRVVE